MWVAESNNTIQVYADGVFGEETRLIFSKKSSKKINDVINFSEKSRIFL